MISYQNASARLKNEFTSQEQKIESAFDDAWKTIKQVAQVDEKYRESVKEIVIGNAEARGGSGSLASFVTEAVPNIDSTTANRLIGIIDGRREMLKREQQLLTNIAKLHNDLVDTFPGNLFLSERLEARIISSTRTKEAIETGVDDDVAIYEVEL